MGVCVHLSVPLRAIAIAFAVAGAAVIHAVTRVTALLWGAALEATQLGGIFGGPLGVVGLTAIEVGTHLFVTTLRVVETHQFGAVGFFHPHSFVATGVLRTHFALATFLVRASNFHRCVISNFHPTLVAGVHSAQFCMAARVQRMARQRCLVRSICPFRGWPTREVSTVLLVTAFSEGAPSTRSVALVLPHAEDILRAVEL